MQKASYGDARTATFNDVKGRILRIKSHRHPQTICPSPLLAAVQRVWKTLRKDSHVSLDVCYDNLPVFV